MQIICTYFFALVCLHACYTDVSISNNRVATEHNVTTNKRQQPNDLINPNNFDALLLEQLVLDEVNRIRAKQRLTLLRKDALLKKAAKEQNNYGSKRGKLSHEQRNSSHKRTLRQRVEYFNGKYLFLGENLQYVGFPSITENGQRTILYDTYSEMAKRIVANWVKSPSHYENVIEAGFNLVGTHALYNHKKDCVYIAQVYGDAPVNAANY